MESYNHAVGCVLHGVAQNPFYRAYFYQAHHIVVNLFFIDSPSIIRSVVGGELQVHPLLYFLSLLPNVSALF
jgi:hypothetical protein